MKYINQYNFSDISYLTRYELEGEDLERGKTTTVASSGCGLCSAIMVLDRLVPNCELTPQEAVALSHSCKANHRKGTDYKRFAPKFAETFDLRYEMTNDPERLRACLRTGGAAVLHVKGDREGYVGVFSHGGHYAAAIGEEPDGRIAVLDPSYKEGKYEEEGRQGLVEMKNGVIALCDMQVLIDDTAPADPSFYLFWRK